MKLKMNSYTVIQEKNNLINELNTKWELLSNQHNKKNHLTNTILNETHQNIIYNQKRTIETLQDELYSSNSEITKLKYLQSIDPKSVNKGTTVAACISSKHLPRVGLFRILQNSDSNLNTRSKTELAKISTLPNQELETQEANSKLKFGLHFRYFNTLVRDSKLVNPGIGRGIRAEYALSPKWAITGDLLYNDQAYTIESTQGNIPTENLKKYPGGLNEDSNVQNINTRTKYFDFNLGLKYTPNYNSTRLNFFINPSVVWQIYLPQEYQYSLSQQANIQYTQKSYTGYFGSAHLGLGFEKAFGKNRIFQINLWGEQSFIALGYEKQYVSMFGIGTALLF